MSDYTGPLRDENTSYRTFKTGATRDTDEGKLDFEGFLSPLVIKAFAEYMHTKRKMPDGSMRDSDNWQKGIPTEEYMKSMWRHFFAVWESHRAGGRTHQLVGELLALLFNVQGMAHELLKHGTYSSAAKPKLGPDDVILLNEEQLKAYNAQMNAAINWPLVETDRKAWGDWLRYGV